MTFPWEAAREDEWRPVKLQPLFGGEGGEGGGEGGEGGGPPGESGATTGGGDWGSSGSYDASGFNAANADAYSAALGDSPGGYYDTGGAGIAPGALGAEFGGTFGLSGISGQPGTSAFGAELDAGGGGTSGVGNAIASWAQSTAAGPPGAGSFADLSGGGFSGYTGYTGDGGGGFSGVNGGGFGGDGGFGGGGSYQTGGGFYGTTPGTTFGNIFSNEPSGGPSDLGGNIGAAYSGLYGGDVGGEPSGGPSDLGGDIGGGPVGGPAVSDNLGAPAPAAPANDFNVGATQTPAATEDGEPTVGSEPAGGPSDIGGAEPASTEPTSAEPASTEPAVGSEPAGGPSDIGAEPTSTEPASPEATTSAEPTSTEEARSSDQGQTNWGAVFEGANPGRQDETSVASQVWDSALSGASQAWDSVMNTITPTANSLIESLNPNSWVNPQSPMGMPWESNYGGPFGGPDVSPNGPAPSLAAQLGIQDISVGSGPGLGQVFGISGLNVAPLSHDTAPSQVNWGSVFEGANPPQDNVNWGSVFEGAQTQDPVAPIIESFIPGSRETDFNYDTSPWGSVFEGAPGQQNVNWGSVFEGAAPSEPNWGPPLNVEIVPADQLPPGVANPLANPQAFDIPEVNVTAPGAPPNVPAVPTEARPPQQAPEAPPQGLLDTLPGATPNAPDAPTDAPAERTVAQPPQQAPEVQPGGPQAFIPGGWNTDFNYPTNAPAPQGSLPPANQPLHGEGIPESRASGSPPGLPTQAGQLDDRGLPTTPINDRGYVRGGPPASVRYNNPGAAWPSSTTNPSAGLSGRYGSTDVGWLNDGANGGRGNYIAGFPNPVYGLAYNMALAKANYVGLTVGRAISKWSNGGRTSVPGYKSSEIVTEAMINDKDFWDAMTKAESGKAGTPSDVQLTEALDIVKAGGVEAYEEANPGSATVQQAIMARAQRSQQAAVPLPPARPSDAPAPSVGSLPPQEAPQQSPDVPRPPADIPPPAPVAPDVPRPPADIPTVPPALAARTFQAAMQFGKFLADNLAKSGQLPTNREEGQKALNALAHELARAGYPASVAQRTILETATQGSIRAGYGPNSNYNLLGHVTQAINEMAAQAMQGYRTGKTPEVQGPPSPAQQRSEAPFGQQYASAEQSFGSAEDEAALPEGQQASLLDFLSSFNPISTAEAKGRGRDTTLERAIALAREGGNFGGQPGTSVVGNKVFTFYAPGASGARGTEGPMVGSRNNPVSTLDDVRNGDAAFVSLAGHPDQFGQQVFIGDITYTSPLDNQQHTLHNVIGRVDDTGGKFRGKRQPRSKPLRYCGW